MEVTILKNVNFAISPRAVITLVKGNNLTVGDKGTNQANIDRMIELEIAEVAGAVEAPVVEAVTDEVVVESVIVDEEESSEIDTFDNKDDLEAYARDLYEVELDKRQSLKKMKIFLKEQIKGE